MKKHSSFTLIEMLVGMALMMIVMVIIMQVFSESARLMTAASTRTEMHDELRAVLSLIDRDVSGIISIDGDSGANKILFATTNVEAINNIPLGDVGYYYNSTKKELYRNVDLGNNTLGGVLLTEDDQHLIAEYISTFTIEYLDPLTTGVPVAIRVTITQTDSSPGADDAAPDITMQQIIKVPL